MEKKRTLMILLVLTVILSLISVKAFADTEVLNGVSLPTGLEVIDAQAFENDTSIVEINIPITTTVIGPKAFSGCVYLQRVNYAGTQEQWNAIEIGAENDPLLTAQLILLGEPTAQRVEITNDNFKDDRFRNWVLENCDTDSDGWLSGIEIASVTTINVSGLDISALDGIHYFTALKTLDCSNNGDIDLSDVSNVPSLVELNCDNNYPQGSYFDVTQNPLLTTMSFMYSDIRELRLGENNSLLKALIRNNEPQIQRDENYSEHITYRDLTGELCLPIYTRIIGIPCVVTYDANGGFFMDEDGEYTLTTKTVETTSGIYDLEWHNMIYPADERARLVGWSVTNDDKYETGSVNIARDTTLTAVWETFSVVTCDANGGIFEDGTSIHHYTVYYILDSHNAAYHEGPYRFDLYGADSNYVHEPTREYCEFDGWDAPDSWRADIWGYEYDDITEDVTLTARWTGAVMDREVFPDPVFNAFVSNTIDSDGDGSLSGEERMAVTNIDITGMDISSLQGIDSFPALISLNCYGCGLEQLDVSSLTQLEFLDCGNNHLTGLDVSMLKNLKELYCDGNDIEILNLADNSVLLEGLQNAQSELSDGAVNYSNPTDGITLWIGHGTELIGANYTITYDADGGRYEEDIPDIFRVYVFGENHTIPTGPSPVREDYIFGGWIKDGVLLETDTFPVSSDTTLTAHWKPAGVEISAASFPDTNFRSYVSGFDTDANGYLNNREIAAVSVVDVHNSNISSLEGIKIFTSLSEVNASGNSITTLDLTGMNITVLDISANSGIDLSALTGLPLERLICNNCSLTALDVSTFTNLVELCCKDNDELSTLDIGQIKSLRKLFCQDTGIRYLSISSSDALSRLVSEMDPLQELNPETNRTYNAYRMDSRELEIPSETLISNSYCGVTYDANGGTFTDGSGDVIKFDFTTFRKYMPIYDSDDVYREGFIFTGWYYGDILVTDMTMNGRVTLTAGWEPV